MSILNTIDPKVAERWVGEYERKREDNKSAAARARQELGKIIDLAEGAGLNRKAFKDELQSRELQRKMESLTAGDSEDVAEAKEQLKKALGGLPLGDWGVAAITPPSRRKNAAAPGTEQAAMTLAEAREILAKPKIRGRPSAQRVEAERVVEASKQTDIEDAVKAPDGASGEQAAAMAETMGSDPLSSLNDDDRGDNVEDLRPRFAQKPSDAA